MKNQLSKLIIGPDTLRFRRILVYSLFGLLFYLTCIFLSTPLGVMVDFPCFVEMKDSIMNDNVLPDTAKYSTIFVDVFPEHASGGYCYDESKNNGETFTFGGKSILIKDGYFTIDNTNYSKDKFWTENKLRFGIINPWWYYDEYFQLTNLGFTKGYINSSDSTKVYFSKEYLIISGHQSSDEKFNFLTLLIFLLLTIMVIVNFKHLRKLKKNNWW